MTHKHLRIKAIYIHHLDGRTWLVRLVRFDRDEPKVWYGELYGEQDGIPDRSPVWGKVNELESAQ